MARAPFAYWRPIPSKTDPKVTSDPEVPARFAGKIEVA